MEMRKRGFEIVKGYDEKEINIPKRKTKYSAGYDFEAAKEQFYQDMESQHLFQQV